MPVSIYRNVVILKTVLEQLLWVYACAAFIIIICNIHLHIGCRPHSGYSNGKKMYVVEIIQQFTTSLHPTLPRNVLNADTDVSMQECTLDLLFLHRDSGTFLACYGLLGQTPLLIGDRELHSHGNYISQAGDAVIQSEKKLKKKKKKAQVKRSFIM